MASVGVAAILFGIACPSACRSVVNGQGKTQSEQKGASLIKLFSNTVLLSLELV